MKIFKYPQKTVSFLFNNSWAIFIALVLNLLWFKGGYPIAKAEEGLPLFNSIRTLNLYKYFWQNTDFGFASPLNISRVPYYSVTSLLEMLNFKPWLIQFLVFFVLITTALISTKILADTILTKKDKYISYIASLFYLCNLFTMSQVWYRFVYPLIFLWAYFPLFIYICIRWLNTSSNKYLIYLVITSLIFSSINVNISSVFTLWSPVLIYFIFYLKNNGSFQDSIKKLFKLILVWLLSNSWVFIPIYLMRNISFPDMLDSVNNISSLKEVSVYFPNTVMIFLKQSYYFGQHGFWGNFYDTNVVNKLITSVLIFVILGVVVSIKKNIKFGFLITLLLIGWFVSKGYNPPFGKEFFSFIFAKFPPLQTLRNPYEKFGLVFVLPYSIFFSIGVFWFSAKLRIIKYPILIILCLFLVFYTVKPMWSNSFFSSNRVIVPDYYNKASLYIKNECPDGRILQTPFSRSSDVNYSWGYTGTDPSEFLFENPSVSKIYGIKVLDDFYWEMPYHFDNKYFGNILSLSNICAVVIHKDLELGKYNQENVNDTRLIVKNWKGVDNNSKVFGDLEVFTQDDTQKLGMVYLATNINYVSDIDELFTKIASAKFDISKDSLIIGEQTKDSLKLNSSSKPEYKYTKLNVENYLVDIKNAKEPYLLVLANNYNKAWVLKINGQEIGNNVKVNGFANGWVIDQKGDYQIDLKFKVLPWN